MEGYPARDIPGGRNVSPVEQRAEDEWSAEYQTPSKKAGQEGIIFFPATRWDHLKHHREMVAPLSCLIYSDKSFRGNQTVTLTPSFPSSSLFLFQIWIFLARERERSALQREKILCILGPFVRISLKCFKIIGQAPVDLVFVFPN